MQLKLCILLLLCCCAATYAAEILFIISCPSSGRHNCRALRQNLWQQQQQEQVIATDYAIKVHIIHELFNYWTLLDALPHLRSQTRLLNAHTDWIIWCQHNTHVSSLRLLLDQLQRQDAQELAYYGHALHDAEATIVHHFAHYKNPTWFPYPLLSAGVVFTGTLLRSLAELVAVNATNVKRRSEFAIDAAHELARFIFDNLTPRPNDNDADDADKGHKYEGDEDIGNMLQLQRKIILKSAAYICPSTYLSPAASETQSAGATSPTTAPCVLHAKQDAALGSLADASEHALPACVHTRGTHIYFAIKTCAKFHKERIPIIERTWAQEAPQRTYYSDVADGSIPTISTGLPNVPTGHCAKTLKILQLSLQDIERRQRQDIRWLMLVDDDTLLSVPRLSALLSCYNHSELIYLGERYGYRLHAADGFNYHTGGAGIAFSLPLLRLLLQRCSCPAPAAPDDMILGYCLQALGVAALHAPQLHQARPQDYAAELLQQLPPPISFHKFQLTTPEYTYQRWLNGSLAANHSRIQAAAAAPVNDSQLESCSRTQTKRCTDL